MSSTMNDPYILITDKKTSNIKDILPLLEQTATGGKELLIIADDVEGEAILDDLGMQLSDVTLDMLGRAKSVKVTKETTTIVGGAGAKEDIEERVASLKRQAETITSDYDKEKINSRRRYHRWWWIFLCTCTKSSRRTGSITYR